MHGFEVIFVYRIAIFICWPMNVRINLVHAHLMILARIDNRLRNVGFSRCLLTIKPRYQKNYLLRNCLIIKLSSLLMFSDVDW
jgi:hypothetical protein